jgi:hypothetical protein
MDPEASKKKKKGVKHKASSAAESGIKKAKAKASGLCAGSAAHKKQRWKEYEGDWEYERWSNVYDSNMDKASKSREAVEAYQAELGWGELEVTVDVEDDVRRRIDIADEESSPKRAIEHKTGYICLSEAIQSEVDRDAELVKQGWDYTWHFERDASRLSGPSAPLVEALTEAGIKITYKDV